MTGFWASYPQSTLLCCGTSQVLSSLIDANGLNKMALKKSFNLIGLNSFLMIAGNDH